MNKKLLCLLISSFLLSGCANFKKINTNELAAEKDAQKATEYAKKIRNNPVIQDSTKQWINTTPIIEKQVKQSAPPCPIVINTRSDIELRQIAQRITQTCHIPVRISADVWTYLNGTGTGSTQQMTGSIPAPDAGVSRQSASKSLFWRYITPGTEYLRASCPTANRILTAGNILEIR